MSAIVYGSAQAKSLYTSYAGIDDSHVYVLVKYGDNKVDTYANNGRSSGCDQLVGEGLIYNTWLKEYMPNQSISFDVTGISFAQNGVCQTYAARELLFSINNISPYLARANDVCTMYYGKYGCGLKLFEKKLKESFNRVCQKEPYTQEILNTIVSRIYNTADEEVEAWIRVMKQYLNLDVVRKFKYPNDWEQLKQQVNIINSKRESIFEKYYNSENETLHADFSREKKEMYITQFRDYLMSLASFGYFTTAEAKMYSDNFEALLRAHVQHYREMLESIATN